MRVVVRMVVFYGWAWGTRKPVIDSIYGVDTTRSEGPGVVERSRKAGVKGGGATGPQLEYSALEEQMYTVQG